MGPRDRIIKHYNLYGRMGVEDDWMLIYSNVSEETVNTKTSHLRLTFRYIKVERIS